MKHLLTLCCIGMLLTLSAQDIHFTQFYANPTLLNPSLAGHFPGNYRIAGIYRNQWSSITGGGVYSTPSLGADFNFKRESQRNSLGAGLTFYNDRQGGGDIANTAIVLSGAYHIANKSETQYFSIGLAAGYSAWQLNESDITFFNQFDASGNPTQGNGENFMDTNQDYYDFRVGLTYAAYPDARRNYRFGISAIQVFSPELSFLGDSDSLDAEVPVRLVGHGELTFPLSDKTKIMPVLLVQSQRAAFEANIGANLGYELNDELELIGGGAYRIGDAAALLVGVTYKGVQVNFSYDFNVSSLTPATNAAGGYELSARYIGFFDRTAKLILPALRFF